MRTVLIGTGSIGGTNIPTPVNDKLTRMIKEIEDGRRKICVENIAEL